MNNKFIPILTVLMTISMVVFVAIQSVWLKNYYTALDQDFSNKVHTSLEKSVDQLLDVEVQKYYARYNNFDEKFIEGSKQPTSTMIQTVEDSGSKRQIVAYKSIVEQSDIPISKEGDSIKISKMFTDESITNIQKSSDAPQALSAKMDRSIESGEYNFKEFARLNADNLPIEKRVDPTELDSIVSRQLKLQGIDTPFGFAVIDQQKKLTSISNQEFKKESDLKSYTYPLFTDNKQNVTYQLALNFPDKNYALAKNNIPMLSGTFLSLLTIIFIYALSLNYMLKQKKISEIKTDFINNMSHEFKTPLATISVASDSLNNDKIANNPEKVKYYSGLIKQENLRMKKQVESILNMSKLERNEVKLFLKKTNVQQLIENQLESFGIIVNERNGNIKKNLQAENNNFRVDEMHFTNMLINLLDNANKYSPNPPEITVETKNEGNYFVISITDKGIGMDAENKNKIFDKFFREETGNIHNVKGQGLGLSYVKKIVELHQGEISVKTSKNNGSTFTVKIPTNL